MLINLLPAKYGNAEFSGLRLRIQKGEKQVLTFKLKGS